MATALERSHSRISYERNKQEEATKRLTQLTPGTLAYIRCETSVKHREELITKLERRIAQLTKNDQPILSVAPKQTALKHEVKKSPSVQVVPTQKEELERMIQSRIDRATRDIVRTVAASFGDLIEAAKQAVTQHQAHRS